MGTGDFAGGDADGTGGFKTGLGPDYGSVEGTGGNDFDLCRGDCVGGDIRFFSLCDLVSGGEYMPSNLDFFTPFCFPFIMRPE